MLPSWNSELSWDQDKEVILIECGDDISGLGIYTWIMRAQREEHITCCRRHMEGGQNKERILERDHEGAPYGGHGKVGVR